MIATLLYWYAIIGMVLYALVLCMPNDWDGLSKVSHPVFAVTLATVFLVLCWPLWPALLYYAAAKDET